MGRVLQVNVGAAQTFMIGLLLGMKDRTKMWILGGAFLLTSAMVYFVFLAAWLNVFLWIGELRIVTMIAGLIAVDTLHALDYPVTEEQAAEMIGPLEADFPAAARQFAATMIRPDTDAELVEWIKADMAAAPADVAVSAMRGYTDWWMTGAAPAVFADLPVPVVGVYADLWPVDSEANRRHMRSFEAIVLEGTDHFLMLSAVDEFNRALAKAIATFEPRK